MSDVRERAAALLAAAEANPAAACTTAVAWVVSGDDAERDAALQLLCEHGDARYAYLALGRLDDANPSVVAEALHCLGTWGIRGAAERVASLVESDATVVSAYAIWCLGIVGDAETHHGGLKAIVSENDGTIQAVAAAEACFRLGAQEAWCEEYVLGKLAADDPELRAFAANSLVGMVNDSNHDRIVDRLAAAVRTERSAGILPSLQRALAELS